MKNILIGFLLFSLFSFYSNAQVSTEKYMAEVKTLDNTISTLYAVISGDKEEARDWELMKYLFHPKAKLIPSGKDKDGIHKARFMTVQDYIDTSGKWLFENGFFENEIYRSTNTFGNITHVFSTYEAFKSSTDTEPFMRGINSIQLMNDGERWWIINIFWTQEAADNPIPAEYLPKN